MGHHGSSWVIPVRMRAYLDSGKETQEVGWHRDSSMTQGRKFVEFSTILPDMACVCMRHGKSQEPSILKPFRLHTLKEYRTDRLGCVTQRCALVATSTSAPRTLGFPRSWELVRGSADGFVETRNIRNASKNNENMKITSVIQCNPVHFTHLLWLHVKTKMPGPRRAGPATSGGCFIMPGPSQSTIAAKQWSGKEPRQRTVRWPCWTLSVSGFFCPGVLFPVVWIRLIRQSSSLCRGYFLS